MRSAHRLLQIRDSDADDSCISLEILHRFGGRSSPRRGPNAVISVITIGRGVLLPRPVESLMFAVGRWTDRHAPGESVCV